MNTNYIFVNNQKLKQAVNFINQMICSKSSIFPPLFLFMQKTRFSASLILPKQINDFTNNLSHKSVAVFLLATVLLQTLTPIRVYAAAIGSQTSSSSSMALEPANVKIDKVSLVGSSGIDNKTGALTYSYPVSLPAGIGATTPALSLSYRSDAYKKTEIGYGWSMALPKIERINKTGIQDLYSVPTFASTDFGELVTVDGKNFQPKYAKSSGPTIVLQNNVFTIVSDGVTYFYGEDSLSRLTDGGKTAEWYLSKVVDQFGNTSVYTYSKQGNTPLVSLIEYSGHISSKALYAVTFRYEKQATTTTYEYAIPKINSARLAEVTLKERGNSFAIITLGHTVSTSGKVLLSSIFEKRKGSNNSWSALPETKFTYENSAITYEGAGGLSHNPYNQSGSSYIPTQPILLDKNEDGIVEVVNVDTNAMYFDSNGDGKEDRSDLSAHIKIINENIAIPVSWVSKVVDLNNDGLNDIIARGVVYRYTAKGFVKDATLTQAFGNIYSGDTILDMNNDGLVDLVLKTTTSTSTTYIVKYQTSFGVFGNDTHILSYPFVVNTFDDGVRFMDINNDSFIDAIMSYESKDAGVCPSNLYTLEYPMYQTYQVPNPPRAVIKSTYLNTGSSFVASDKTPDTAIAYYGYCGLMLSMYIDMRSSTVYDKNGDGVIDIGNASNITKQQDVLTSITNETGLVTKAEYSPVLSQGVGHKVGNRNVVKNLTTSSVLSGVSTSKTSYTWNGSKMFTDSSDISKRSFAGFQSVEVSSSVGKVTTYYHQGDGQSTDEEIDEFALIGLPYKEVIQDATTGATVKETKTLYNVANTKTGHKVSVAKVIEKTFDGSSAKVFVGGVYTETVTDTLTDQVKSSKVCSLDENIEKFGSITSESLSSCLTEDYSYTTVRPYKVIDKVVRNKNGATVSRIENIYDYQPKGGVTKGLLTEINESSYTSDGVKSRTATSKFAYNNRGLIVTSVSALNLTTSVIYDAWNMYPSRVTVGSKVTTFVYDYISGKPTEVTGSDGITNISAYDGFGRTVLEYQKNGQVTTPKVSADYYVDQTGLTTILRKETSQGEKINVQHYDQLGRLVWSKDEYEKNKFLTKTYSYDLVGRLQKESLATTEDASASPLQPLAWKNYEYDSLGRVTRILAPESDIVYQYSGKKVTIVDNKDTSRKSIYNYDVRGNLASVVSGSGSDEGSTTYSYNEWGNLLQVKNQEGAIRNFEYDSKGSIVMSEEMHEVNDASYPLTRFVYDIEGKLVSKLSIELSTTILYDMYGRPVKEITRKGTASETVTTTYDTCKDGKVCSISSSQATLSYAYDALGRITIENITIGGVVYSKKISYDSDGNIASVTYPKGEALSYAYTISGLQKSVSLKDVGGVTKEIASLSYTKGGLVKQVSYANNTKLCMKYDIASGAETFIGSQVLWNALSCDDYTGSTSLFESTISRTNGLPESKTLQIMGTDGKKKSVDYRYVYDSRGRIINENVTAGTSTKQTALSYDLSGRLASKSGIQYVYSSFGDAGFYAPSLVGDRGYSYDRDGNTLSDGLRTYVWNAKGLPSQVTNGSAVENYLYAADGRKISTKVSNAVVKNPNISPQSGVVKDAFVASTTVVFASNTVYFSKNTSGEIKTIGIKTHKDLLEVALPVISSAYIQSLCSAGDSACLLATKKQALYESFRAFNPNTVISNGALEEILAMTKTGAVLPVTDVVYATSGPVKTVNHQSGVKIAQVGGRGAAFISQAPGVYQYSVLYTNTNYNEAIISYPSSLFVNGDLSIASVTVQMYDWTKAYGYKVSPTIVVSQMKSSDISLAPQTDIVNNVWVRPDKAVAYDDATMSVQLPLTGFDLSMLAKDGLNIRIRDTSPTSVPGSYLSFGNQWTGSASYLTVNFKPALQAASGTVTSLYVSSSSVGLKLRTQSIQQKTSLVISADTENVVSRLQIKNKDELMDFLGYFGCTSTSCDISSRQKIFQYIYETVSTAVSDKSLEEMRVMAYGAYQPSNFVPAKTFYTLSTQKLSRYTACTQFTCAIDLTKLSWTDPYVVGFASSSLSAYIVAQGASEKPKAAGILARAYRLLDESIYGNYEPFREWRSTSSVQVIGKDFYVPINDVLAKGAPVGSFANTVQAAYYKDTLRFTFDPSAQDVVSTFGTTTPEFNLAIVKEYSDATTSVSTSSIVKVTGLTKNEVQSFVKGKYFDSSLDTVRKNDPLMMTKLTVKPRVSLESFNELASLQITSATLPGLRALLISKGVALSNATQTRESLAVLYNGALRPQAESELAMVLAGTRTLPSSDSSYTGETVKDITSFTKLSYMKWGVQYLPTLDNLGNDCNVSVSGYNSTSYTACVLTLDAVTSGSLPTGDNVTYELSGTLEGVSYYSYGSPAYKPVPATILTAEMPSLGAYPATYTCKTYCFYNFRPLETLVPRIDYPVLQNGDFKIDITNFVKSQSAKNVESKSFAFAISNNFYDISPLLVKNIKVTMKSVGEETYKPSLSKIVREVTPETSTEKIWIENNRGVVKSVWSSNSCDFSMIGFGGSYTQERCYVAVPVATSTLAESKIYLRAAGTVIEGDSLSFRVFEASNPTATSTMSVDGKSFEMDITSLYQRAKNAGQTSLLLSLTNAKEIPVDIAVSGYLDNIRVIEGTLENFSTQVVATSTVVSSTTKALLQGVSFVRGSNFQDFTYLSEAGRAIVAQKNASTSIVFSVSTSTRNALTASGIDNGDLVAIFNGVDSSLCASLVASTSCLRSVQISSVKEILKNLTGIVYGNGEMFELFSIGAGLASVSTLAASPVISQYMATGTLYSIATTTQNLAKVPLGLLGEADLIRIAGKSLNYTGGTTTKPIANSTLNELLQTGVRDNDDIRALFTYAAKLQNCSLTGTSSLCVDATLVTQAVSILETRYGIRISAEASNDILQVMKGYYTMLPDNGEKSRLVKNETVQSVLPNSSILRGIKTSSVLDQDPETSIVATRTVTSKLSGDCFASDLCEITLPAISLNPTSITLKSENITASSTLPIQVVASWSEYTVSATSTASTTLSVTRKTDSATTTFSSSLDLTERYTKILAKPDASISLTVPIRTVSTSLFTLLTTYEASYPQTLYSTSTRLLYESYKGTTSLLSTATSSSVRSLFAHKDLTLSGDGEDKQTQISVSTKEQTSFTPLQTLPIPTYSLSLQSNTFDCMSGRPDGTYTYNWNNCIVGYGMYGYTHAATEVKIDLATRESLKKDPSVSEWRFTFTPLPTPESNLKAGDTITLCAMYYTQVKYSFAFLAGSHCMQR